ncbi:MAG: outer membrane beta-barrel protein [Phaeodactylibacter sp.]|nr:outer membrane beta-barrel protein [Phaeodactylibacter sp.]MCB9295308.1 outer membrane beta-barrel protein [Lewinellaceae bacterium]
MRRMMILSALLAFACSGLNAQTTFKKGDVELAAGIGVFPTFAKDDATTVVPPVSARLDVRLAPNFSLGAYAAFSSSEARRVGLTEGTIRDISNKFTLIGLRAAAHANRMDNWDIYGGAMLGYNIPRVSDSITKEKSEIEGPTFSRPAQNEFTYSAFVGASYYPVKNIGLFAEVGYGISIFNLGVSAKL